MMTALTGGGISVSVLLLVSVCLGLAMMFVGGWYFQSSLVELRTMVANQHDKILEQKKQMNEQINGQRIKILTQIAKTTKQEELIQQLNEKLDTLLQLQIEKSLFQVCSYKHSTRVTHQLLVTCYCRTLLQRRPKEAKTI